MAKSSYAATTRSLPRARGIAIADLFGLLLAWQDRWRQRQLLAEMDGRMLRDLGLSRGAVAREIEKPFWRQ